MLIKDLLETGGPFPQRLHLAEPLASFYADFLQLVMRWCDEMLAEVDTWPSTKDVGLTPGARKRLQRILDDSDS